MNNDYEKLNSALETYDGLYGDRNAVPDAEYVFSELLQTRSPKFGWSIKPHQHPGLLQVFFIDSGNFEFFEAERKVSVTAPCVLIIPSAALHGFNFNDQVTGRIITMAESYYISLTNKIQALSAEPAQVIRITAFNEVYTRERVRSLIETIDQELNLHEVGKQIMLRVCFQQLFLIIHRLAQENVQEKETITHPASRYYRKFLKLMHERGGNASVTTLAHELAISPVHLNRISKQLSGKPASQLIQEYLIAEAKKYLTYTGYSVSEIAYILHFEYPNYFARLFKKHTGLSPKAYRLKRH